MFFFFNDTATTEIYTLSLHDALPISIEVVAKGFRFIETVREERLEDVIRAVVEFVDAAGADLLMRFGQCGDMGPGALLSSRSSQAASLVLLATAAGAGVVASDLGHRVLVAASFARVGGTSSLPPRGPERAGDVGLRLFRCARCGREVRVCVPCDHGQIYCAGDCRAIRRRESVRRAGATYQGSRKGARKHAARQRQLRLAKSSAQKVTHHAFSRDSVHVMVASSPATSVDAEDRDDPVSDHPADRGRGP